MLLSVRRGVVQVDGLTKGRIVYNLAFGVALTVAVAAASFKPWWTVQVAAIGALVWSVMGVIGSGEPRQYVVRRLPADRLPPQMSVLSALAPEVVISGVVLAGFGVLTAVMSSHRAFGGAVAVGYPIGSAVGKAMELFLWRRIAREEQSILWIGAPSLVTRRTARRRGVTAVADDLDMKAVPMSSERVP